ncbi:MAG: iron-sulfur cluster assembly protein [Aquificota bacterium]|nr:iron-sulfur cluster assembly protein [Aquificota bacterium]
MEREILEALKEVRDPEIPIDIVNLGLIYGIRVKDEYRLHRHDLNSSRMSCQTVLC